MVLQKVGEYVTDIVVNGTNEASFSQAEDSTYDINASPSLSGSTGVSHSVSIGSNDSITVNGNIPPGFMIVNSEVTLEVYADFESAAEASIAGVSIREQNENSTTTQTVNISGGEGYTLDLDTEDVGGANANASISYEMYTTQSVTTDSVTKD